MGEKELRHSLLLFALLFLTTFVIHGASPTYATITNPTLCARAVKDILSSSLCNNNLTRPITCCSTIFITCAPGVLVQSIPSSSFTTAQLEILSQCGVESIPVPVASPALAPTPLPSPMAAPTIA